MQLAIAGLAAALTLTIFAPAARANCYDAAMDFRREVEVDRSVAYSAAAEKTELPIAEVYDQARTQWCWAYSAFHTMRHYYSTTTDTSDNIATWKKAVLAMDTHDKFRGFMKSHFSTGTTGDPQNFVRAMTKYSSPKLPADNGFKTFIPTSGSRRLSEVHEEMPEELGYDRAVAMSRKDIAKKIHSSLQKGIAVAYCYPPHCVTIYGDVYENGVAKEYLIADSTGGQKYRANAKRALQQLDMIMTRD